ncbi:hypothetical protein MYX84_08670 [Acidobacteria bacterium AH-259-O06]|nr:hypothetical protein [Acidobacteria bacterium AH-259-O06]
MVKLVPTTPSGGHRFILNSVWDQFRSLTWEASKRSSFAVSFAHFPLLIVVNRDRCSKPTSVSVLGERANRNRA